MKLVIGNEILEQRLRIYVAPEKKLLALLVLLSARCKKKGQGRPSRELESTSRALSNLDMALSVHSAKPPTPDRPEQGCCSRHESFPIQPACREENGLALE